MRGGHLLQMSIFSRLLRFFCLFNIETVRYHTMLELGTGA